MEVLGLGGTTRYLVLFVMELKTRAVEIAGIRVNPGGEWRKQIARNLTDRVDGFLQGAKCLIHDQDPLFAVRSQGSLARGVWSARRSRRRVRTAIRTRRGL